MNSQIYRSGAFRSPLARINSGKNHQAETIDLESNPHNGQPIRLRGSTAFVVGTLDAMFPVLKKLFWTGSTDNRRPIHTPTTSRPLKRETGQMQPNSPLEQLPLLKVLVRLITNFSLVSRHPIKRQDICRRLFRWTAVKNTMISCVSNLTPVYCYRLAIVATRCYGVPVTASYYATNTSIASPTDSMLTTTTIGFLSLTTVVISSLRVCRTKILLSVSFIPLWVHLKAGVHKMQYILAKKDDTFSSRSQKWRIPFNKEHLPPPFFTTRYLVKGKVSWAHYYGQQ